MHHPDKLSAGNFSGIAIKSFDTTTQRVQGQPGSLPVFDYGAFALELTGAVSGGTSSVIENSQLQKGCLSVAGDLLQNEKYSDGQKIEISPDVNMVSAVNDVAAINNKSADPAAKYVADWQKWYLIYIKAENGRRYYQLRNAFSGQLLAVRRVTNTAGTGSTQFELAQTRVKATAADRTLWQIKPIGGGKNRFKSTYILINKAAGLAIGLGNEKGNGGNNGQGQQSQAGKSKLNLVKPTVNNSRMAAWKLTPLAPVAYRDDAVVGFFERGKKSLGSVAFDQGNTIALNWGSNKGKVLWITEDAWDGEQLQQNGKFSCKDFFRYRNSVLIQPSATDWNPEHTLNIIRTDSRQHMPKQICDLIEGSEFAWPSVGIEIGNKVYLQCAEGDGLGPVKSQSLYELTEKSVLTWPVKRLTPARMTTETRINYSAGMVDGGDGYVYVFGFQGKDHGYGLNLHVARFAKDNPMDWHFWDGKDWTDTPSVGNNSRIATGKATVSVAKVKDKYVMMTMDQGFVCDSTRNIYLATANSPTGPFTPLKKVYTIREYLYGKFARYYTPVIHPEFNNGHCELLLTYCLNFSGCGVPDCKDGYLDPYFYRIKGIRVPYELFGL